MKLRPYQEACIEAIINGAKKGISKPLIVLPTGTGKTVVFGHLPSKVKAKGKKTLILAHREELLNQAKEKLEAIDPDLKIGIEQGENLTDENVDVVIASVPTLGRGASKRIMKFDPEKFGLIIVDEAHHATSSTYINIFRHFGVYKKEPLFNRNGVVLLGVTATPNRSDGIGLGQIFDDIVFNYQLLEAIKDGYLVNISAYTVNTEADISRVSTRAGDFSESELAEELNTEDRNKLIVDSYKDIAHCSKALAFAVNVEHTIDLSEMFRRGGYKSDYIVGTTPSDKRAQILEDFKNGDLQVLTNCGVLTEGFDSPSIQTIIMARPTKSSVLYSQMIGRGTRLFPGKDSLKLIDFVDNTGKNQIMTLPSLFGIDKKISGLGGRKITEVLNKIQDIHDVNPSYPVDQIEDWSDENIEKIVKRVDIFAQAQLDPEVQKFSKFSWEVAMEGFRLKFPPVDGKLDTIVVSKNLLDKYDIEHKQFIEEQPSILNNFSKWGFVKSEHVTSTDSLEKAFQEGDKWISEKKGHLTNMFGQDSEWRKNPPSDKQLQLLRKLGVAIHPKLTKGECSVLIGKALSNKR